MAETILIIVGAVAVGAALVALGAWGVPKLRDEEQGYPLEAEIEAVLVPFAFQAICAAYRVSEWGVNEFGQLMAGIDKKKVADSLYKLLPSEIAGLDISIVKNAVPPDRWRQIVQDAFDRFDSHFIAFTDHYEDLYSAWSDEFYKRIAAGDVPPGPAQLRAYVPDPDEDCTTTTGS